MATKKRTSKMIPNVVFEYNIEKDVQNIKIGLDTVRNGRKPDPILSSIIKKYGENPMKKNIVSYVERYWDNKKDIREVTISQIQEYWDSIEEKFFNHLSNRMQLESFYDIKEIKGFLSIRRGAGYNAKGKNIWFGIMSNYGTLQNTLVAMHEIMHIFFYKQWWNFCKKRNIPYKNIWDIKEAMTILLNLWFKNQIIHTDLGYKEHTKLRINIKKWFLDSRDFKSTLEKACDYMEKHPKESPEWIKTGL